tara:strand:+ start:88 stop:795 length:708 start_codon:yes stop_codon:yes gene_type:complete
MKNKKLLKYINKKNSISRVLKSHATSLLSYDNFLENCNHDRIQKIVWKYELFKMIQNIPGDIVECGVHKGSGIYLFAKLVKIFKPNSLCKVLGFDFFGKSQKVKNKFSIDYKINQNHQGHGSNKSKILKNLRKIGIKNVKLISGDVCISSKLYVKKNIGFRISMLILDVDNYEGTLECLKNFYPHVTRGGIIVFDEYALEKYGESDAVDEFFKDKKIKIKTVNWSSTPSAYIIKQ